MQVMDSVTIDSEYRDVADVVSRLQAADARETTAVIVSANSYAEMMSRALND